MFVLQQIKILYNEKNHFHEAVSKGQPFLWSYFFVTYIFQ